MSATLLLLLAACLLAATGGTLILGMRAGRRRGQAAGALVDQHLGATAAKREGTVTKRARPRIAERPLERLPSMENLFLRAGIVNHSRWILVNAGVGLLFTLSALVFGGMMPAGFVLLSAVAGTWFCLWLMVSRRHRRIVRQLPTFLDALIRQVTMGTSLGSAFQQVAPHIGAPLGELIDRAAQLNRAGVELDVAVKQVARVYAIDPLLMIGAVLGVSTRFGGRSDQVLERIAGFMRDIEQGRDELSAMSAETRMSAWILGLLPLGVAGFIMIFNNHFFSQMWSDPMGAKMLIGAAVMQAVGSFLLYRLAKSI